MTNEERAKLLLRNYQQRCKDVGEAQAFNELQDRIESALDEAAHTAPIAVADADKRELLALAERILRHAVEQDWPMPSEFITRATRLGVPIADL